MEPREVVRLAKAAGLSAMALTDHDTLNGVNEAELAGDELGIRVIGGCEFSVSAPWGEMHLLGYFLPSSSDRLEAFLAHCRADRVRRARAMVERLRVAGAPIAFERVLEASAGGSLGRPHVARALLEEGFVGDINEAFNRYLGRGRPAFVDKVLPTLHDVAALVHSVGGLVSAAHLKDRANRSVLERFRGEGLDAVEVRHPSHSPDVVLRLSELAAGLGLLVTGGSDWHGESLSEGGHGSIGAMQVPAAWLGALEARRAA